MAKVNCWEEYCSDLAGQIISAVEQGFVSWTLVDDVTCARDLVVAFHAAAKARPARVEKGVAWFSLPELRALKGSPVSTNGRRAAELLLSHGVLSSSVTKHGEKTPTRRDPSQSVYGCPVELSLEQVALVEQLSAHKDGTATRIRLARELVEVIDMATPHAFDEVEATKQASQLALEWAKKEAVKNELGQLTVRALDAEVLGICSERTLRRLLTPHGWGKSSREGTAALGFPYFPLDRGDLRAILCFARGLR